MSNNIAIFSNISDCQDKWEYLESLCNIDIFQSYKWNKIWADNYLDFNNSEIFIVIFYKQDKPFFLIPLYKINFFFYTELRYMGDPLNDYNQPLIDPRVNISQDEIDDIWNKIFNESKCDLINLNREKNDIHNFRYLSKFKKNNNIGGHYSDILTEWDFFYIDKKSKKARYNLKRQEKQLSKLGLINYTIKESENIDFFLEKMIEFKSSFYSKNNIKNIFISITFKKKFIQFYKNLNEKKLLSINCLYLNNKIIAIHIGYIYKNSFYYIFPSYNLKYKEYSPGILLLKFIMEHTFNNNFSKFDFTIGDEEYKSSWSNKSITTSDTIRFFSIKGLIPYIIIIIKKIVKRIVK